jgi:hypothetical protein
MVLYPKKIPFGAERDIESLPSRYLPSAHGRPTYAFALPPQDRLSSPVVPSISRFMSDTTTTAYYGGPLHDHVPLGYSRHRTIPELKDALRKRGIYFKSSLRSAELLALLEPVEKEEEEARKRKIFGPSRSLAIHPLSFNASFFLIPSIIHPDGDGPDLFEPDKAPRDIDANVSSLRDVPDSEDSDGDQPDPGEEFTITTAYTKFGSDHARGRPLERGYTLVEGAGCQSSPCSLDFPLAIVRRLILVPAFLSTFLDAC